MLLLFLWQNAKCGIIFLTNGMDYRLKFAVMLANDDIHEKKFIFLDPNESCILTVNVSQGERLWVAYAGTICKLPGKRHYRAIDLTDNENHSVIVRDIPSFFRGPVESEKLPFSISCTMEPKWFHKEPLTFDNRNQPPIYLATFKASGIYSDGCNSRVPLIVYKSSSEAVPVPLQYSVEFGSDRIGHLPYIIQDAIAGKYPAIDRSHGLFEGLVNCGVERIFITACGFGPLPIHNSGASLPDFNFDLSKFITLDSLYNPEFNQNVFIGILGVNGIMPWNFCSVGHEFIDNKIFTPKACTKNDFGCFFTRPGCEYVSCYVVAITSDLKSILITHVLVAISEIGVEEIRRSISSAINFQEIPISFKMAAGENESKLALENTGNVLETMSSDWCERKGPFTYYCSKYFPVEEGLSYILTGELRSAGTIESSAYFGVACYDENKSFVPIICSSYYNKETETELVEDCNAADKVIFVNASNWLYDKSACIAFNVDDGTAKNSQKLLSSRVERVAVRSDDAWEVHLLNGIDKNYQKGTKVRYSRTKKCCLYYGIPKERISRDWEQCKYTVCELKSFPSIKYIKIVLSGNHLQDKNAVLQYRNIELKSY